jgi:FixJ family two-component response regulator
VLSGGMSGREVATALCAQIPSLRVLYMSGYTANAVVHHGRLAPDVELLHKPFRKIDLARAVRHVLDSGR